MKKIIILLNNNIKVEIVGTIDIKRIFELLNTSTINVVKIVNKIIPKHRILAVFVPNTKDDSEANLIVDIQNRAFNILVKDFDKTVNLLEKDLNTQTNEFILIENELIFFKHAFNATEEGPAFKNSIEESIEDTATQIVEKDGVIDGDDSE